MIQVRPEEPGDIAHIRGVHTSAFPSDTEARLVDALRDAGQLSISLVAADDRTIIGHIGFSPVRIEASSDAIGFGLAPVAVIPSEQGHGAGAALIRAGIERCRELGVPFVVVLGDPRYYQRFGFRPASQWGMANEYGASDEFMALELSPGGIPNPAGVARYAPPFALFT